MGWYPRNTDEMTQTFDTLVGRQLVGHPETTMLITSMSGVGNGADVLNVLSSLTDFKGNGAASDEVGIFVASNEVTALDALRQLEQGAARFMQAAIESLCYVEIPGQSVQVKFPGVGKTWVDLKKFASLTGTAEAATGETFSAYVHVTPEPNDATQNRFVFVAIQRGFPRKWRVQRRSCGHSDISLPRGCGAESKIRIRYRRLCGHPGNERRMATASSSEVQGHRAIGPWWISLGRDHRDWNLHSLLSA